MAAYVISDVRFLDADAVRAYRAAAARSIEQYGGRYIVRGGAIEVLEGNWNPQTLIIVEFDNLNRAREWYQSPEYARALKHRDKALSRNLLLVEGC